MNRRDVGGALARVLSLVVLGGCGGGVDTSGFLSLTCQENGQISLLPGIHPAQPADYIELWEQEDIGNEPRLRGSMGTKCGTATDVAACQAAVEAATSMSGFTLGQCVQLCTNGFFVVNRGDEVVVVDTEAALSFLALGVQDPTPTWGNMLDQARSYMFQHPWLPLVPGIPLVLVSLAFNFIGDGMRDALDPRLKQ